MSIFYPINGSLLSGGTFSDIHRGVPVSLNKALIEHLFRKQLNFNPKQYQQIYRKETKGGKVSIKPNTFQRET